MERKVRNLGDLYMTTSAFCLQMVEDGLYMLDIHAYPDYPFLRVTQTGTRACMVLLGHK